MATRVHALKLVVLCLTAVTAALSVSPPPKSTPTPESVDDLERTLFSTLQIPLEDANVSAVTQILAATIAASKLSRMPALVWPHAEQLSASEILCCTCCIANWRARLLGTMQVIRVYASGVNDV